MTKKLPWMIVIFLLVIFVWSQASKQFDWAKRTDIFARQTIASAIMSGQQSITGQDVHPDAAKWKNDKSHLRQIVESGHDIAVEWARASIWQEVRLVREPILLKYGEGGFQSADYQLEDWRLPVKVNFVRAITQNEISVLPESLVPIAQLNSNGIDWTYGWVWISTIGLRSENLPLAAWWENSNRDAIKEGEEVIYRANCILKPGQRSETLIYSLPENFYAQEYEYDFFSIVRQLTRLEGVIIDVNVSGQEGGGGSAVNNAPNWQKLPKTMGAVVVSVRLMEPSPVDEVPVEFVFARRSK
jgi:hypothetical protein